MKKNNVDHFEILRKISKKPEVSQRELAEELGFSLGKLNYCIKQLKQKGLIKIKNFEKNPKKMNYLYVLTPQGISSKTRLTINFMRKKMQEYDELKAEMSNKNRSSLKNNQTKRNDNIERR
jgi:MarR family transcriptional regulator, temperature-dependent positive regulator of motility